MSKQICFTFTIVTRPKGVFVFMKWFDDVDAAIVYAKGEIKDRSQYDVDFILIREGDAKPSDPVIWDSRDVISLSNLAPVLDAAMPIDIRGSVAVNAANNMDKYFGITKASEVNTISLNDKWVMPEPFKVKQKPNISERQSYNCRITPTDCISCYVSDSDPKLGDLFAIVATNEMSQKVSALLTHEDALRLREQLNAYIISQV